MTQNPVPQPRLDARGAIDLSALGRPAPPAPGTPGGLPAPGAYVVDVTEESFPAVVQASTQYPVVIALWAGWSEASRTLLADLGELAGEYAGKFLLARVDAEASPQIATAFQVQSVPTVVALLAGQPVPLFQGAYPPEQVRGVLDQLAAAAAANGVTGTAPAGDHAADAVDEQAEVEPPLAPLHQAAFDAIESDDFPAAVLAYEQAIKENPRDALARAGLAQVELLQRTHGVDPRPARAAAADRPDDVDAQLLVADLDLLAGSTEDAFGRLIDLVRHTQGTDRDRVRTRLVGLFEVVGSDDARVIRARRELTNALY